MGEAFNIMPRAWCLTCGFDTLNEQFPPALLDHANDAHMQFDGAHEPNWISSETGNGIRWNDKGQPYDETTGELIPLDDV